MLEKIRAATAANRTFFLGVIFFLFTSFIMGIVLVLFPDMPYMLYMLCLYIPAIVGLGSVSLFFTVRYGKTLLPENPIRARQILKMIPLVLCGYLAMLPMNIISMILNEKIWGSTILESAGSVPIPESGGILAVSIVIFALLPAIFEEWLFRGIVQRANTPNLGKWVPLYTAVAFGLMHGNLITDWSLILIGFLISMVMYQTGSLKLCVWYHFLHNTLALSLGFFSNKMQDMLGQTETPQGTILEQVGMGAVVVWLVIGVGAFCGAWFLLKSMQVYKGTPMDQAKQMKVRNQRPPQWVAPVLYVSEIEQRPSLTKTQDAQSSDIQQQMGQQRPFAQVNYVWYILGLALLLALALLTAIATKFLPQ